MLRIRNAAVATLAIGATALAASQDFKSLPKSSVRIDGSSTVYPITEAVAEEFSKVAPQVNVTVGLSGTGGGFKRFCAGEIDISDASRPIKKSEVDQAKASGIEFIEVPVAFDGLTIVAHPRNKFVDKLTVEQVTRIFSANGGVKTWKDLDPAWPAQTIKVFSPGTDSGTFDYFREVTVGKDGKMRSDMTVSEDDNVLVTGVAGDPNSIGFFGCAYYFENKDKVRAVPIVNKKGEAILPAHDTVTSGAYEPFSRPLFIYANRKAADRPEIDALVRFYLEKAPKLVEEVGYVALPESVYGSAMTNWKNRRTGSQFMDASGNPVHGPITSIYK